MKRFRLEAWHTKTRVPGAPPDVVAEFPAHGMIESLLEKDDYAARILAAIQVDGDPVEVRIVEVEP